MDACQACALRSQEATATSNRTTDYRSSPPHTRNAASESGVLKTWGCVTRATYADQRTQSVTNGYFGGYIGKRQPAGSLETQKHVDKLLTLRAKMQGRGRAAQLRASSGRLITELEMNSTYRGAVEIFNLRCNLADKRCPESRMRQDFSLRDHRR